MQQQEGYWVNLLIKTRLKENVGIQSSSVRIEDNWVIPIWVTLAISPLGNLIEICTMEITDVKNWREWTIWSVAPLSKDPISRGEMRSTNLWRENIIF